jgi:hypothetical protein
VPPVELGTARPLEPALARPVVEVTADRLVVDLPVARPRPRPRPVPDADGVVAAATALGGDVDDADAVADRPRRAAPRRCATRYTDDSPIPNRLLISETGVSVSVYDRATSRSCSSLSLRRVVEAPAVRGPVDVAPSDPDSDAFDPEVSVVTITSPSRLMKVTVCAWMIA